jgi:PRC-barrel domain protein
VLHLAQKIRGAAVHAVDGEIGSLEDFYFEEGHWVVRYLLVDTGKWLNGRRVLLSPMSVSGEWNVTTIPLHLTREQVENSPRFDPQDLLSRETETQVLGYYGYPYYWGYDGVWGSFDNPGALLTAPTSDASSNRADERGIDPESQRLRSIAKSTGYHLQALDGDIGHVDDFLIGEQSWRIRYLLVDTSNWIGGRSVLISSEAVDSVDRQHEKLHVSVTRNVIEHSPSFESIEAALDTRETGPPFSFV